MGDAENDLAFLDLCGLPVAVANALPPAEGRRRPGHQGVRGAGVAELVDRRLATDLVGVDVTNPRQDVPLARRAGRWARRLAGVLAPLRHSLLLTGLSGGGKSTLTTGVLERLPQHDFQLCVMDPEGDYEGLGDAVAVGTAETRRGPRHCWTSCARPQPGSRCNLLAVKLADRPAFRPAAAPAAGPPRATGRPHFVVVDEAHHMLPATWDPGGDRGAGRPREASCS